MNINSRLTAHKLSGYKGISRTLGGEAGERGEDETCGYLLQSSCTIHLSKGRVRVKGVVVEDSKNWRIGELENWRTGELLDCWVISTSGIREVGQSDQVSSVRFSREQSATNPSGTGTKGGS